MRKNFQSDNFALNSKMPNSEKNQNDHGILKKYFPKNNFKNRTLKKMKYLSNQDQNIVSVKLILFYPKINK